jgi:hypothetical protein
MSTTLNLSNISHAAALALVDTARIRPITEYSFLAATMRAAGKKEAEIVAAIDAQLTADAKEGAVFLNKKIAELSAEYEYKHGSPVATIEVDWAKVSEVLPTTDASGKAYPAEVFTATWIANSFVKPFVVKKEQLTVTA